MTADWPAIRAKFEQGISQRTLATEFGVSQSSISRKAASEKWCIIERITPSITDAEAKHDDLLSIISTLLQKVATYAQAEFLEPKDIKLLADALSQFHKIRITTTPDQDMSAFDMRDFLAGCTDEELEIVRPIIAQVQARRENITPLRRTG